MAEKYKEIDFEEAIERHLLDRGGYTKRDSSYFDSKRGMDSPTFIDFIMETQSKEWEALYKLHKENTKEILLDDLCRALNSDYEGCLKVLRHGLHPLQPLQNIKHWKYSVFHSVQKKQKNNFKTDKQKKIK